MPLTEEQFNKLDAEGFTPEEIAGFEQRRLSEQQPTQPGMEKQNILGQLLNVPGAAIRSAIQGKGYAAGAMNPSQVPSFQQLAIDAVQKSSNPGVNAMVGMPASALGLAADVVTNPADVLGMLLGKTPMGAGKTLGGVITESKLGQAIGKIVNAPIKLPKSGEPAANIAKNIRQSFVGVKQSATDKFGAEIERLSTENPNKKISLTSIADEINSDFDGYTQEFKNIVRKIPNVKFKDGKISLPDNISVGKVQEMVNYIKTKIPPNIKYQHLDLLDLEGSLKAAQLEAFPEMAQIRQDYAKVIQPYNAVKQQFKFNRLLNAIKNDFGGEEGKMAVQELFKNQPQVLKKMGGYKKLVESSKLGKEVMRTLLKTAGVGAGAGLGLGAIKLLKE